MGAVSKELPIEFQSHLNTQIGLLLIVIFGIHFFLFYGTQDVEFALHVAGYLGVIATLAYFASPLLLLVRILVLTSHA